MRKIATIAVVLGTMSCSSLQTARIPAESVDLSGTYLGEAFYKNAGFGKLARPAVRLYLHKVEGERDSYNAVLLEYDRLESMAAPYLSAQTIPALNQVIGYLNSIATRISAYRVSPGAYANTYDMRALKVVGGEIQPVERPTLTLTVDGRRQDENPLAGAKIIGASEAPISFPSKTAKHPNFFSSVADLLTVSQYELAVFMYDKGHLASTWRGDWNNLAGSYLSEYGKLKDGVLELFVGGAQKEVKFMKSRVTKPKDFTNPKSAFLEGDYAVSEPVKEMFVLSPARGGNTASDRELTNRIGLFLDVFDGSAPEAGGHLVVELAFINPEDPKDFLMYYEHPQHAKGVGVDGAK